VSAVVTGPRPEIATIGNAGVKVRWRGHDVRALDGILETTLRVCTYFDSSSGRSRVAPVRRSCSH